jgi:AraC-like DNA-binding protein
MQVWSTDGLPPRERFAYWNDAVCDAFLRVRTEREQRSSFNGRIGSTALGGLRLNHVRSEPHLVRRDRRALAQGPEAAFFVNLHATGQCVLTQAERDHVVGPGDISFHDGTRLFDLRFLEEYALTCFIVPRCALLARTLAAPEMIARPLPRGGATALFRAYAASLAEEGASLSANETDQAAVTFLDLLALALGANAQGREIARLSTRAALFRAICAQIRHHLANPALDLAGIAKRAGLAPRTLQTVFQQHGTSVTSYILEQRLRLAERQLAAGAGRSITEIAYAAGFSDLSYFSRAFRQRFGISPSDRRTAARGFA